MHGASGGPEFAACPAGPPSQFRYFDDIVAFAMPVITNGLGMMICCLSHLYLVASSGWWHYEYCMF